MPGSKKPVPRLRILYLDPFPNDGVSYYKRTMEELASLHDLCWPGKIPGGWRNDTDLYAADVWAKLLRKQCGVRSGEKAAYDWILLGWSYTNHAPPRLPAAHLLPNEALGKPYPRLATFINKEYQWIDYKFRWLREVSPTPEVVFTAHQNTSQFQRATKLPFVRVPFAVGGTFFAGDAAGKTAYTHDFGFSGRVEVTDGSHDWRGQIHARIQELRDAGMRIFFTSDKLPMEEYRAQLRATKMWLSTTSAAGLVGTRYFDVMSTGTTLLLANNEPELYEGILEPGVHAVTFDSVDDLFEKIRYYAAAQNEVHRMSIVSAAARLVKESHTYASRTCTISQALVSSYS